MLPTPLRQHLQTVKFRYSPPSTFWPLLFPSIHFETFSSLWPAGRPSGSAFPGSLTIPWWPYIFLGKVERESDLESDATQTDYSLFNSLPTQSHTFGTVSSCPSSQKSYLHPPEKKILSWWEAARSIVAHVLPQRGARMSEGSIFFCHVDVSFLIYRIFF